MTETSHRSEQKLVEQEQQSFRANEAIPFLEAQQHYAQLAFNRDSSLHLAAHVNNNPQSSSTAITDQKEYGQNYYINSLEQFKNLSQRKVKYPRTSSPTTPLQGDDEIELAYTYSPQQRNNKKELPPSNLSEEKQYPLPRILLAENQDYLLPEGIIAGRLQKQSADFQGNLSDLINTNEYNEECYPNAPNDSRLMSHIQSGENSNYTSSFGVSDIMFLSSKHKKTYNIQQKRLDSVAQSKDESLNKGESSPMKAGSYTFQNTSQQQSNRENNTQKEFEWNQREGSQKNHRNNNNNNNNNTIKEISIGKSSQIANNNYKEDSSNRQDSMLFGVKSYHDDISEMHNAINTPTLKGKSISPIWKKRFLSIIQKVARFLNIMIGHSRTKKFSYLRREDFQIIGDLASSYKYYLFNGFLEINKPSKYQKIIFAFSQQLKRYFGSFKMLHHMGVLKPYQKIKVVWDVIILILTFINIIIIPIMCFFEGFDEGKNWMGFIYLSCIMFVSDVFIKLNTAFFQHGIIQEKRKIIIQRYYQGEMIVDCVTLIPYVLGACGLSQFLLFVIVLKAFSMSKVRKHLMEVFQPSEVVQMIIRILNVFMLVLFIAHLTSSGFVWVATQQNKDLQQGHSVSTWITQNNLTSVKWSVLYINGLYWAIISMITIGYGDITPVTPMEKLYTIIISMISCAVFAYCINTISQIITDLKQKQKKLKERITNLNRFLMTRNLDMHLQMKVRKFIEYLHYSEESEGQAIKDLELIPKSIREEVQIDIYGRIIRKIKLFHINFSSEAINNIALRVTESSFGPGEIVFKQGENSENLFILLSGRIELSIMMKNKENEDMERSIAYVEKGHVFGVEDFFGNETRKIAAKAIQLSYVMEISHKGICAALASSESDLEKFKMIKDRVRFSKTTRGLGVQCLYCGSYDHSYISCPNVTLSPNKPLCLAKHNYSIVETERSQKVRLRNKSNTISNLKILNKSIQFYLHYKQFQENLQNIDGCTDETAEVAQARKGSSFSTNAALAMRHREFQSTSILMATDQGMTPIQHNGCDPNTPRQRSYSETNSDDSYLPVARRQSSQKPKKELFKSHSGGIRYNRRNLTNIAEERSVVDVNTNNSASFQSQLVSTINFAGFDNKLDNNFNQLNSTTDKNKNAALFVQHSHQKFKKLSDNSTLFNNNNHDTLNATTNIQRRLQNGGRNRTWNGVQASQAQDESISPNKSETPSPSKEDPQLYLSNNRADRLNQLLISSPHYDIFNGSNCTPSSAFQSNNNLVNNNNQNQNPSMRSAKWISQDLIPRGSNTHIVQERKSSFTPRNNAGGSFLNQSNGHPQSQTQLLAKQQSLNMGSQTSALNILNNNNNLYQNQHSYSLSNSDMNNQHRNNIKSDQRDQQSETIVIHSIRNIKANNNWEDDVMRIFDRFKIFKQYFPYNNIDKVLLRFNGAYFLVLKKQQINQQRASLKKQILLLKQKSILEGGLNSSKHSGHKKQSFTTNNALDLGQLVLNKSDNKKQNNIADPTRQSLSNIINNLSSYSAVKESRINIAQQTNKTISFEQLTLTQVHSKEESL